MSRDRSSPNAKSLPAARGKSQGWAAFDLKQRQKQQPQQQVADSLPNGNSINNDPFPPLPTAALRRCAVNNNSNASSNADNNVAGSSSGSRTLSSVFPPSVQFPPMSHNDLVLNQLKQLHSGADDTLIQDVLYSVDNDTEKASSFLKQILSAHNSSNYLSSNSSHSLSRKSENKNEGESETPSFENNSDIAADIGDLSSTLEHALKDNHKHLEDVHSDAAAAAAANMNFILGHLKSIPVEPEWEEHDLYLIHRRDAFKMMRLASRHSKAATNAFMIGDHFSAQQESLKARKEWLCAERLNTEAAKNILSLRNSENNLWKLDLHGLHAAEAVQALQEHLKKIETQLPMKRLESPSMLEKKIGIVSSSVEPFGSMGTEKSELQRMGYMQRPASLQVITDITSMRQGQVLLMSSSNFVIGKWSLH
ncbi:uncharacterized protein LOC126655840 isoform X2 [Mercurialis annua]|uniref:uncharacterized protein LOC126655840 isoform X2 n=1 Tax=Mercurialis annua TaxID=3986 RepID=UPI002160A16F|nr:uncharacterized protein LOC126655840 isoform X2 [Mercurialis annua]XP_050206125.1 uncharacterized protein LOC126655840 isoform X2 [Mercurialis annua]